MGGVRLRDVSRSRPEIAAAPQSFLPCLRTLLMHRHLLAHIVKTMSHSVKQTTERTYNTKLSCSVRQRGQTAF
jgi:hypothetical protein